MSTSVLKRLPLRLIFLAAILIIGISLFITSRNRQLRATDSCGQTDKAFREYAVSQDISLLYRPLAAVIENKANAVIVAGRSPSIGVFSLADEKQLPALRADFSEFHSLALNEEKGYLVGGTADGATVVWNKSNDVEIGWNTAAVTLPGKHKSQVSAVAISDDGALIGASSDDTVFVWQKEAGSDSWVLKDQLYSAHSGLEVRGIAFGDDRNYLFSAGNDSRVKVWEASGSGSNTALFSYVAGDSVDSIAVDLETETAFIGLRNGSIEVWEVDTQPQPESATTVKGEPHSEPVKSLAVSTADRLLVSGSNDKTVKVWGICTGEIFQTFLDHSNWVTSVDISSGGDTIVSTGIDNRVIIRSRQSE